MKSNFTYNDCTFYNKLKIEPNIELSLHIFVLDLYI